MGDIGQDNRRESAAGVGVNGRRVDRAGSIVVESPLGYGPIRLQRSDDALDARSRFVIVDDHRLFADALENSLEASGLEPAGIAATAAEAVATVRTAKPDLVLVDLVLPDAHGIDLGRALLDEEPHVKLLAISILASPGTIGQAIGAGFHGYVTKSTPLTELIAVAQAVLDGQIVLPRQASQIDRRRSLRVTHGLIPGELTPREHDVLVLLVEGVGGPQIAKQLSISPNTVRTHVQSILTKLGVHSRLEAVAFARRHGIVDKTAAEGPATV